MMNLAWDHRRWSSAQDLARHALTHLAAEVEDLRFAFDLERARTVLAPCWPGLPAPRNVSVENVWYTPGKPLIVVYGVDGADETMRCVTVVFDAPERPAATATPRDAMRLAHWPATAWRWPHDPRGMPVAEWLAPGYSEQHLRSAQVDATLLAPARVLSYLPGSRCALGWTSTDPAQSFVMKAQAGAARNHTALRALWMHPGRRFGMAEPIAADAAGDVRWERFVVGRRIETAAAGIGWEAVLRATMRALARLHNAPAPGLAHQSPADIVGRLDGKVMRRIRGALPSIAPACEAFAARLRATAPLDTGPAVTLHGDLHTGNLLMTSDDELVFIDLDEMARGPATIDIALLASRLMLICLLDARTRIELAPLLPQLPGWYASAGGALGSDPQLEWYVAALLVARQAKTCVRHLSPDMASLCLRLLVLAESVLADGFNAAHWDTPYPAKVSDACFETGRPSGSFQVGDGARSLDVRQGGQGRRHPAATSATLPRLGGSDAVAQLALRAAVDRWGLAPITALTPLAAGRTNESFRLVTANGTFVLRRCSAAKTRDAVRFEQALIAHLSASGLPVALPIAGRDRMHSQEVDGRLWTLAPFVSGQHPKGDGGTARLGGATLARFHDAVVSFVPPVAVPPEDARAAAVAAMLAAAADTPNISPHLRELAERTRLVAQRTVAILAVMAPPLPRIVLHAGCRLSSLLIEGDGLVALLDFDSARRGPVAEDVAIALASFAKCRDGVRGLDVDKAAALVATYRRQRSLADADIAAVPAYLAQALLYPWALGIVRCMTTTDSEGDSLAKAAWRLAAAEHALADPDHVIQSCRAN